MAKQTSIEALNNHLFEAIEMLKNNSDPQASDNEKMDLETAGKIADLGKVVVEGYKIKLQALKMVQDIGSAKNIIDATEKLGIFETKLIQLQE